MKTEVKETLEAISNEANRTEDAIRLNELNSMRILLDHYNSDEEDEDDS